MVMDWGLVGVSALLFTTLGALVFYYRRLRNLREEYEKAKTIVGDIAVSFNKQVQTQEEKMIVATQKAISANSRSSKVESGLETQSAQLAQMTQRLDELTAADKAATTQLETVATKITDVTKSQEALQERMVKLEEKFTLPEANMEAVIPFRQEKALASLTPTELMVLEILANEGDKTAPEIKARVNLTREHTARLMKKLYEEGYLERTTGKIPFAYRIKEEMRKILKKPEAKT